MRVWVVGYKLLLTFILLGDRVTMELYACYRCPFEMCCEYQYLLLLFILVSDNCCDFVIFSVVCTFDNTVDGEKSRCLCVCADY